MQRSANRCRRPFGSFTFHISVAQCKTVIIAEFSIVLQRQQRFEVRVFGSVRGLHVAFNNHKAKRCVISKIRPHVKETKA